LTRHPGNEKKRPWEVTAAANASRTTAPRRPAFPGARNRRELHGKESQRLPEAQGRPGGQHNNPSPPIGPALGKQASTSWKSAKSFNAQTQQAERDSDSGLITIYQDAPSPFRRVHTAVLCLKKAAKPKAGSKALARQGREHPKAQVRRMAEKKGSLEFGDDRSSHGMVEGSRPALGARGHA